MSVFDRPSLEQHDHTLAGRRADELTFWVRDHLPSWNDNDPYYALRTKAKELFAHHGLALEAHCTACGALLEEETRTYPYGRLVPVLKHEYRCGAVVAVEYPPEDTVVLRTVISGCRNVLERP